MLDKANTFFNDNVSIKTIEKSKDFIFMIATNPKVEASILNARIRFLTSFDYFKVYSLGFRFESNFKTSFLNFNIKEIIKLIEGKSMLLSIPLINSEKPLFIFSSSLIKRGFNIFEINKKLALLNPSLIFIKIENYSNSGAVNYINFKNFNTKDVLNSKTIVFLNCKESHLVKNICLKNLEKKIFWLNPFNYSHMSKSLYSIISKNIYEETGTYFNLEFRPQISHKIFKSSNKYALFDILIEVFSLCKINHKYNSFINQFLECPETFEENIYKEYLLTTLNFFKKKDSLMLLKDYSLKPELADFFKGSFLAEKSKNMLSASRHFRLKRNNFF
jgi:hypothetical protein